MCNVRPRYLHISSRARTWNSLKTAIINRRASSIKISTIYLHNCLKPQERQLQQITWPTTSLKKIKSLSNRWQLKMVWRKTCPSKKTSQCSSNTRASCRRFSLSLSTNAKRISQWAQWVLPRLTPGNLTWTFGLEIRLSALCRQNAARWKRFKPQNFSNGARRPKTDTPPRRSWQSNHWTCRQ